MIGNTKRNRSLQFNNIVFLSKRDLCGTQSRKLDQLEEENVRMENQLEQKQLDWETRDVELEELQVIDQSFLGSAAAA